MTRQQIPDIRFSGTWIGETQGCEMPAHLWEIRQHGWRLTIHTRWEGEGEDEGGYFYGHVLDGQPAFRVSDFTATLVDPQHFIIPGWCTNDKRGGVGPAYDVVFSRPGLAELTAQAVWLRHRQPAAEEDGSAG